MKKSLTKLLTLLGVFLFLGAGNAWADWTVYFLNPRGWSDVYVHAWNSSGDFNGGWPGASMSNYESNNDNILKYTFKGSGTPSSGIIFNGTINNSKQQTGTLKYSEGELYDASGIAKFYYACDSEGYATSHELTKTGNPWEYSILLDKIDINGFKIRNTTGNDWDLSYGTNGGKIGLNTEYQSWKNAYYNIKPEAAYTNVTLIFNALTNKITLSQAESGYELRTHIQNTNGNWENIAFTKSGNNWVATISPAVSHGEFVLKVKDQETYYKVAGNQTLKNPQSNVSGNSSLTLATNNNDNGKLAGLDPNESYTLTWNPTSKTLTMASGSNANFPPQLYLYGHVNNKYWATTNKVDLLPVNGEPGKYTAEYVDISGFWSPADVQLTEPTPEEKAQGKTNPRKNYESTESENYVVVYDNPVSNFGSSNLFKYGSFYIDNTNDNTVIPETGATANLDYHKQDTKYNFRLTDGLYDVEVDLNKMIIKFTPSKGKKAVQYTWFEGENIWEVQNHESVLTSEATLLDNQDKHNFTYGNENKIQVGVGDNSEHRTALQAEYKVWYTETVNKNNVKKYAGAITENPNPGIYEDVTDNEAYYTNSGDTNIENNPVLTLKKVGTYIISADITKGDDLDGHTNNKYEVTGASIEVAVRAVDATLSDKITLPFSTTGVVDLGSFALSNKLTYGTDFTVSITPQGSTSEWESFITDASTTTEDLMVAYQDSFSGSTGTLFQQLSEIGFDQVVDGFYDSYKLGVNDVTGAEEADDTGNYNYDIKVNIPCSGVYTLTISPTSTNAVTETTSTVTIYPDLYGTFNNAKGFNINGYMWEKQGDDYVITFPENANLENVVGFIPGTYFASSLSTDAPVYTPKQKVNGAAIAYRTVAMDLTGYDVNNTQLKVTPVKNDAQPVEPFIFYIKKGTVDPSNVSTGVEAIGAEDGEVVYYNLQGVKVENPEKGIYVKVQNGKATKIAL